MKLFIQGLVNVVTFGLDGKTATTDAEKAAVLMTVPQPIKDLIEIMSKYSILVLICLISTSISSIAFGLRVVLSVIFNGNPHVVILASDISNAMYSTDLLINCICQTFLFDYFGNTIYDKYCFKLHNVCKNMVINHVFSNAKQQSPNAKITVV